MNLVIVESPGKAKTIGQYLGDQYIVLACYGHIYDLPKKNGVDIAHDFEQNFQLITKNKKHIDAITQAAKKADCIFLATDPDREGEAIAWHIADHLHQQRGLKKTPIHRVSFNQITAAAIKEAIAHPREVHLALVDAQKARRALDYLVGFNLSPLLWKKVRPGLSAGRVQSPALRMIAEREAEIRAFKPVEYWDIWAIFGEEFQAKLSVHEGKKLSAHAINSDTEANATLERYRSHLTLELVDVARKEKSRKPYPPFQTSTLQQEASKQLGFSGTRTMSIAQKLYEGIDLNGERQALITYMRTDSTHMAPEAITEIRAHIKAQHGDAYLPKAPRVYSKSQKNAQEAHEAIRPIDIALTPAMLSKHLDKDGLRLYDLIWRRTLASQMNDARLETQTLSFSSHQEDVWRLSGTRIVFDGFLSVFKDVDDAEHEQLLPLCQVGDKWTVQSYLPKQHFTDPPPRYTEASLIKTLEEYGIGRPSTYATIPTTLIKRDYVTLDKKRFQPTPTGEIVNQFLVLYFTQYVDYDFTAELESSLDDIAHDEKKYVDVMRDFWTPFHAQIEKIGHEVTRAAVTTEATDESCPECQEPLVIKLGRAGRFVGCSSYPNCTFTRPLDGPNIPPADHPCPKCGKDLSVKVGRYGPFYGCTGYPECRHIETLSPKTGAPTDSNITCPKCTQATLVSKKSRFNKIFYGCSAYPSCNYALWNPPIAQACPACAWPILTVKTTKRHGTQHICPNCAHSQDVAEEHADKAAD